MPWHSGASTTSWWPQRLDPRLSCFNPSSCIPILFLLSLQMRTKNYQTAPFVVLMAYNRALDAINFITSQPVESLLFVFLLFVKSKPFPSSISLLRD